MSEPDNTPIAPKTRSGSFRDLPGSPVSFETYFLRDLYLKGKIDDALIERILESESIACDKQAVIATIKQADGTSIPKGLTVALTHLAQSISEMN